MGCPREGPGGKRVRGVGTNSFRGRKKTQGIAGQQNIEKNRGKRWEDGKEQGEVVSRKGGNRESRKAEKEIVEPVAESLDQKYLWARIEPSRN